MKFVCTQKAMPKPLTLPTGACVCVRNIRVFTLQFCATSKAAIEDN